MPANAGRVGRRAGTGEGMSPIVDHPDVAAMLMRMTALTAAARVLCYACAHAIDLSRVGEPAAREFWSGRAALLTPIAKSFATDAAVEVASLGIQVHGGAGYIEATGAAQHLRDARIFPIYEGTNGIQAIDLVSRKLKLAGGAVAATFIAELAAIAAAAEASNRPGFGAMGRSLSAAVADLRLATDFLAALLAANREREVLIAATPYLKLFALAAGGALLARCNLAVAEEAPRQAAVARYFAGTILEECSSLRATICAGAEIHDQGVTAIIVDTGARLQ